jgi:uncharacterized protein with PIN domain
VRATVRCYAELNDFLPRGRRQVAFEHTWEGRVSVKDLIEGLGVPHGEVDLLLVNGESSGFDRLVEDGDRVAAFPVFESFDVAGETKVRPEPLRQTRFVLDVHLGRLAAFLRLAGFDVLYQRAHTDAELAAVSAGTKRILLSRDQALLKRRIVTHGYYVRSTDPAGQLAEVVRRFDLRRTARPFTRCMVCNGAVEAVSRAEVADLVPPRSRRVHDDYRRCRDCGRVYWKGTHYERLTRLLDAAFRDDAP